MNENNDTTFMGEALRLAALNIETLDGGPFGAVITRDGEIIASASNSVVRETDPTAHAEINAIREAARRLGTFNLSGCVIYSSCEPCPMCLSAIWWARLDACHFAATRSDAARAGFDDDLFYQQLSIPGDERQVPVTHMPMEDAARVFDEWIRRGNDIAY